ncbi:reverse transcriptase, partial [Globisporangium splendens]
MAATVTLCGETVLLLNIYAPSTVFAREAFYRALSGLLSSHDGPILCGGDFNCTLNQTADRSHNSHNKVHDSRELKKLLQKLNLVDTLEDDALRATDTRDVKAFHRQHHTYYYTLPSDGSASSRLDRWYCSNDHLDWVRSVYQSVAGPFSDHNGVTIRVAAPDKVIQSKKPRVVYPLPKNAAAHSASIGKDFFEKAHDQLDELRGRYSSPRDYALATANWWDEAKIALRIGYLEAKKSYFARLNQGYKKKIQRLQRRLSESEVQMLDYSGGAVSDQNVELSQEFLTTATSIRRAIAECKSKWQASKRDRIFREHMHHERKTSKSFCKRISTKFLDNTIFTLGGTATCGPMRSRELADDMGEGWKTIMQQVPTLQTDIDQILDPGTAIPPSDRLGFLLKPIESSEIKQAVKKCKRGKAHGPDELGNDWYRDHCDEITGLFERLFNLWIPECVLPSSFSEAHIHCIKKSVSAASPLDYRPIALLNSDYKIFTRIFATRLRTVLPWLIHHMQAGFVPGRAIPTTIDVLLAAQQRATSDPAMSRAIALLLDFAKAYDSLDRSFLAQTLQHLGFPLKFVHLVKVLHSQTTYKFIVNGFLSRKYNVTSGIRQGCPLVPLLFILALEVLYRKIEASDEIHGVELQAAGCATEVRLGGYADDTTIYLSDPKDINAVFAILDKYGAASGLRVNRHKSAVLPLSKEYSSTEESSDKRLRMQVTGPSASKCIQALRVRLRLARLKTHSVAQRAAIASAVIIPKVLYVARHSWPSTAIVNQLHDLVKQFVWGSRNGKPAKPWMKEEQAELKKMNGGLSVPNIRTELMTMSATAVSKWAITTSHIDQVIGEILLHNTRASSTYITPLDAIPRRPPQLRDNMWTTGAALCASLHSRPYEPRERDNVRWCYEHFKSTIAQTQWDGDVFQIDLSSKMSDRLPGIIADGRKLRGTFCAEWLPYMTSTADGWLLDSNGSPYKLAHTSLSVGTAQRGGILRWEWIRPGRHYNHEWHLNTSEATLTHVDTTLVKATHTVHSAMDCDIMATRDLNGQKVLFYAHPRFTRVVQLWGGNGRYNTTRSFNLRQVAATRTQIGKDTRDAAVNKAVRTAGSLWFGLQLIQWSELHNIPGITVYTAQTLLQLKANRLSMWNYEKADLSSSNPECSQVVQSSVRHLFWECPKAKLVWNYFYALWTKIGITPGHDPAFWIFSLDLPDTPRHAWTTIKRHIIGHKLSNEHLQDHLYPVAHMLCRYMSSSLIHAIWCAHLRRMDSDPIKSTAEMAVMMTRLEAGMRNLARLAEVQAGDSGGHTFAAVLKAYVDCILSQTDAIPLTPNDTRGVYLLFFDGGSRGNPGPGGTGSIIVRVHKDSHTASLIWAASMSYSRKDTTNNFAEYWGLIHGLREAQRSHFKPLYVIGDSTLIISQQRMHRSPRQHRLARLYQTSRRLEDCIDIRGWYHHYRAFNKMADSATNLAMDTRTSTQVHFPTQRAAFNNLTQDLDNDVMHWLMRSSEDPRNQSDGHSFKLMSWKLWIKFSSPQPFHEQEMEEETLRVTDEWTAEELALCVLFGESGSASPSPVVHERTSGASILSLQEMLRGCDGWSIDVPADDMGGERNAAADSAGQVGDLQTAPEDTAITGSGDTSEQTENDLEEEARIKLKKLRARKRDDMQRMRKRRRELVVKMKATLQLLERQYERLQDAVQQRISDSSTGRVFTQSDVDGGRRTITDLIALADDVRSLQEEKFWLEQLRTNQQRRLQRLEDAAAVDIPVLGSNFLDTPPAFAFSPITRDHASKFVRRCYENMRRLEQMASPLQPPTMTELDDEVDREDSLAFLPGGSLVATEHGISSPSETFGWSISVQAASTEDTYICFSKFFPGVTPQIAMLRSWSQVDSPLQTMIARRLAQYKVLQVLDDSNYVVGVDMEHPLKPGLLLRGMDLRFRLQTNTGYVIGRTSLNPQSPEVRALSAECSGFEYADSLHSQFKSTRSTDVVGKKHTKQFMHVDTNGVPTKWSGDDWIFYKTLMPAIFEENGVDEIVNRTDSAVDKKLVAKARKLILNSISSTLAHRIIEKGMRCAGREMGRTACVKPSTSKSMEHPIHDLDMADILLNSLPTLKPYNKLRDAATSTASKSTSNRL